SQMIRGYAMFVFMVALALWMLLRAIQSDRPRDWAAFAAASILGAYTHYYFVIFLAISLLLLILIKRRVWIGKRAFVTYAAIAVCGLPLPALLPADFHFQTNLRDPQRLTFPTLAYTYLTFFTGDALGPSPRELHTLSVSAAVKQVMPWIVAIGTVV